MQYQDIFQPPLVKLAKTGLGTREKLKWGNLHGSSLALAIASSAEQYEGLVVVVTEDTQSAEQLERELQFFCRSNPHDAPLIHHFPDWETLPYDNFSAHQDIISQRLDALYALPRLDKGILIVPVTTLMHRLPPKHYVVANSLVLQVGQQFEIDKMRLALESVGYHCVDSVYEHGEFAVRGSIMDIFPMGSKQPYRIDLFDDEIDSLRTFDVEDQRSLDKVSKIRLLPGKEFPLNDTGINDFRRNFREKFDVDVRECPLYQDISQGIATPGVEYYLALFFEELDSLFDYLPAQTLLFTLGDIEQTAQHFYAEINNRYENRSVDKQNPILPPGQVFLAVDEIFSELKKHSRIQVVAEALSGNKEALSGNKEALSGNKEALSGDKEALSGNKEALSGNKEAISGKIGHSNFNSQKNPSFTVNAKQESPLQAIEEFIQNPHNGQTRILFCAESAGRRETLLELLKTIQLYPRVVNSWQQFLSSDQKICMTVAAVDQGLWLQKPNCILITETQLFGQRVAQRRRRGKTQDNSDFIIKSLTELSIGAAVVHIDHGVGRYRGLQTLDIDQQKTEFLCLDYANESKLYVPVSSLHLISRYGGADQALAPLHRLGNEQWQKAKRKAAEKIRDVAVELLDIYARRAAKKGFRFAGLDQDYRRFVADFAFEETIDQENAIKTVIEDMTSERAMDRLICGDVGFGKTEVAMRAAFIAVQSNKQVAILAPTTLLAQQHYESFKDRFADWPVIVDVISRFRSSKQQQAIKNKLIKGQVDIIIGTHKLLQSEIQYKQLGLLIIDEEHRFGVRQKEKLKSMRANVDILKLTATPIPRTLNMAMSGLNDLSIIATPPAKRLSIKTFTYQANDNVIKEAILRELLRGGQVFYLHNDVKTIEQAADHVKDLVPEARVCIGHGQLPERQLEQVMSDYYHKRYNVLVCSTIIETGIDIPSANTIIIQRADKFGLAQLHQLRGRVGRSHHQAYAYLLTPPKRAMTSDAIKRLEVISAHSALASGFTLASHDLEIRGAGELLGDEQSGHIHNIGFTLYSEMLEHAVKAIKAGKTPNLDQALAANTDVNLRIAALIPEDYLPDVHTRLIMYKRIANATTAGELRELQVEMIDRFGLLPEASKLLFRVTGLKLKALDLGIRKIDAGSSGGKIEFNADTVVDPYSIVKMVQNQPRSYTLSGATQLKFKQTTETAEQRVDYIDKLLEQLKPEKRNAA